MMFFALLPSIYVSSCIVLDIHHQQKQCYPPPGSTKNQQRKRTGIMIFGTESAVDKSIAENTLLTNDQNTGLLGYEREPCLNTANFFCVKIRRDSQLAKELCKTASKESFHKQVLFSNHELNRSIKFSTSDHLTYSATR